MEKFTDWHLYVGCEAMYDLQGMYLHGRINQYNKHHGLSVLNFDGGTISQYSDKFKLVLRRLESMTYEENAKYDELLYPIPTHSGGTFELKNDMVHSSMFPDENNAYIGVHLFAKMINELRKDGFDCDRLIESGQAIDKATLTKYYDYAGRKD